MASQRKSLDNPAPARSPMLRSLVATALACGLGVSGCGPMEDSGANFQTSDSDAPMGDSVEDTFVGDDTPGDDVPIDVTPSEAVALRVAATPLEMEPSSHAVDEGSEALDFTDVLATDVTGDGFADFVGVTREGDVYVRAFERTSLRPPFEFGEVVGPLPTGLASARLGVGDFDGDSLPDIIVLSRDEARSALLFNAGAGHFEAPTSFDDPLLGFDDPLLGFDDPLLGLRRPDWIVGDFDGNGFDDVMLMRGARSLTLVSLGEARGDWTQRIGIEVRALEIDPREVPLLGFDDPLLGFDDPLLGFDDPLLGTPVKLMAVELDGDTASEFAIGAADTDLGVGSVVFFDDPLLGFDDPLLGFDDPLLGLVAIGVPGATSDVQIADLGRLDGAVDVAVLSSDTVGARLTMANIASFDDPLLGAEVASRTLEADFGRLAATRMVDTAGAGGSGLPVDASHLLLIGAERSLVVTWDLDARDWVGRELGFEGSLAGVDVTDFNGDGYAEFVPRDGAFTYTGQVELTTDFLASAPDALTCSLGQTLCSGGTLGVCAERHLDCEAGCVPIEDGADAGVYAPGGEDAGLCDGQDNDCDGRVDVIGQSRTATLSLTGVTAGSAIVDLELVDFDGSPKAVVVTDDGTQLQLYHGELTGEDGLTSLAPDLLLPGATGAERRLVYGYDGGELCALSTSGTGVSGLIYRQDGTTVPVQALVPDLEVAAVARANTWVIAHASGGELTVTAADGSRSETVFDYVGRIASIAATGGNGSLLVAIVTDADQLFVLEIVEDAAGGFAVRDIHQMPVESTNVVDGFALAAADDGGSLAACLTYLERSESGITRLAAQRFVGTTMGLSKQSGETLSLRRVDGASLEAASSGGRCQFAWSEALPGDTGSHLIRQAYLGESTTVQTIGTVVGRPTTSLAPGTGVSRLAVAPTPDIDGSAQIELRTEHLCN